MNDNANPINALVNRAKETPDAALVAALNADVQVSVGPDGISVVTPTSGEMFRMELDGIVPVACTNVTDPGCECSCDGGETGRASHYGPCASQDGGDGNAEAENDAESDAGGDDGPDAPCLHQVAALSYLLNNPAELLTALRRFHDRNADLSVRVAPVGCDEAHDLRAINVTNDRASDVKVRTDPHDRTLVEYWAVEHGVHVHPNSRVVLTEVDGGPRRDAYPAEVLRPTR